MNIVATVQTLAQSFGIEKLLNTVIVAGGS